MEVSQTKANLRRQPQLPRLSLNRLPKLVVDFGRNAFEPVVRVDTASGVQHSMRPEDDPIILPIAGEPDAFIHQRAANASPAGKWFDMQQAKTGQTVTLIREEDRPSHGATEVRDPAFFTAWFEASQERSGRLGL